VALVEERRPAEVTGEGGEAPAEGACAGEAASRIGLGLGWAGLDLYGHE
jgi:hypothetical protein